MADTQDRRRSAQPRGRSGSQGYRRDAGRPVDARSRYGVRDQSAGQQQRYGSHQASRRSAQGSHARVPQGARTVRPAYERDERVARQRRAGSVPPPRPPRRKSKKPLVIGIVAAVVVIIGVLILIPKNIDVTVNGQEVTTTTATSALQTVEDAGVQLENGDLLAVDGSILTPGGGEPGVIKADGAAVEYDSKLSAGMNIVTEKGPDVTEEYASSDEAIPAPVIDDSREFSNYWGGSIHLLAEPHDGVMTVKTGTVSGLTASEVKVPAQAGGYQVYTAKPNEPVIALTFDDGPWDETTAEILDILEQYNAKATFFTIGVQIADNADVVKRAHDLGNEVLTHSWDHADGSGNGSNLTYMSQTEQIDEITKGYAAIAEATGQEPPHVMRAPGGNFFGDIIDTLWPYLDAEIGWDIDTEDWRKPGAEVIAERILTAEPGNVILMHDGGGDRSQTVEALRIAMPALVEKGYKFVTVSELLAYGNPEVSQLGNV